MSRGRRAKPAEVKALMGNPGKRRLALDEAERGKRSALPTRFECAPPDFLTQPREREAFSEILQSMPARIARASDVNAIARWAVWLNIWVTSKTMLDGREHWYESESKHGKFLREHPIAKRMNQAETHLVSLEDRLGLNIVARNNIVHRLFNMPSASMGGLFGDDLPSEKPAPDAAGDPAPDSVPEPGPLSPLGYLRAAASASDAKH